VQERIKALASQEFGRLIRSCHTAATRPLAEAADTWAAVDPRRNASLWWTHRRNRRREQRF